MAARLYIAVCGGRPTADAWRLSCSAPARPCPRWRTVLVAMSLGDDMALLNELSARKALEIAVVQANTAISATSS